MKNKSLFSQILKYFLVSLILPFCTIFLLYGYAANVVEEQTVLSSERMLTQFFALVDNVMDDFSQTCISIGSESVCSQHIRANLQYPEESKYSSVKVYHMLKEYREEMFFDVLVYYPTLDQVISEKNGSLPTKDYLISTYGAENFQLEQYAPLLDCNSPKPQIRAFTGADQQTYLCMNMRWTTIGYTEREYVIAIVFSPEFLSSLLIQEHLGEDGTLMIFDAQKKLLLSGDGVTSYYLTDSDNTNTLFENKTENGNYMMLSRPSDVVDGYYAYAADMDNFWEALSALRLVCIVACGLCLVVTVVLVFRGVKKVYNPIGTVVQRAEQMGVESYDRNEHNEIEFISRILDESSAERINLQEQVRKSQNLQRDQFIRAVMKGELEQKEPDNILLEKMGMTCTTDLYRVVLIFVQKGEGLDNATQDFVIRNTFEEVGGVDGCGYVVDLAANEYALLLNFDQNADVAEKMEKLRSCQAFLHQQLGLVLVLSSGRVHQGLAEVHRSCAEAELAMKYKYLLEDVDYIDYEDIKNREFSYASSMESTLSRNIIGFINGKSSELSGQDFVSQIMEMCRIGSATSMDNIECFKYEMVSIINKAFMLCGDSESRKDRIQELVLQPTLEKFRLELAGLLEMLRDMKQRVSKQEMICQKVMAYINENYGDSLLSVSQIGEVLNLSPYYVSKLFKEKYELTISECVAKTRIKNAKEQLISTDKSIKEIAEENGFLSSNVFIRTFKKWEGNTPGIYRKQEKR